MNTPALPITLTVSERGASVENPNGISAMSRFSERAKRLMLDFGPGVHVIATEQDVEDIPAHTLPDVFEGLR